MTDISTVQELEVALFARQDCAYREFQCRLMPTVSPRRVIGVRTPRLRALAKQLSGSTFAEAFLQQLPHAYYEEDNLHGFLIARIRSFEQCAAALDRFLPYVDNWATCDGISPTVFSTHRAQLLDRIDTWLCATDTYTVRFGIRMLMNHFLDAGFSAAYPRRVASLCGDDYYINMMIAWYFATALAKQYRAVLPLMEQGVLSVPVHNKALQKACESARIDAGQKKYLKTLRRG